MAINLIYYGMIQNLKVLLNKIKSDVFLKYITYFCIKIKDTQNKNTLQKLKNMV